MRNTLISTSFAMLYCAITACGTKVGKHTLIVKDTSAYSGKSVMMIAQDTAIDFDDNMYLGHLSDSAGYIIFKNGDKKWQLTLNKEQLAQLKLVPNDKDMKYMCQNAYYSFSTMLPSLPSGSVSTWLTTRSSD